MKRRIGKEKKLRLRDGHVDASTIFFFVLSVARDDGAFVVRPMFPCSRKRKVRGLQRKSGI